MHTCNGLQQYLVWVVEIIPYEVPVHADPLHLAALSDFILANDWDVVLTLTCDRTDITSCT